MTQIKSAAKKLTPLITGFLTAGVLYVANRLNVPVLDTDVEAALTPFVSAGVTAGLHALMKVSPAIKVEGQSVDPLVTLVASEVSMRLAASPTLKQSLVATAMRELSTPVAPPPSVLINATPAAREVLAPVGTSPQVAGPNIPASVAQ